ncbi:MAG: hypothetical protein JSV91_09080 [Phycisphaerales bacterium]|nr:MAG: hypothetical protein JSV91_09080 [Phycisphaerales bacterium]
MPPMPDPPHVGLFTKYVLENPYPPAALLAALAVVMAWAALRDGRLGRLKAAGIPALIAVAALAAGILVTTAGERGEMLARQFVDAVVAEDVVAASDMLSDNATLAVGAPTNPSFNLEYIQEQLDDLIDRYEITSNRITSLRGYGTSSQRAEVHLACRTEVADGWSPTPSRWVLEVERQEDGSWKIARITWISIGSRGANMQWLR